jgi:hypothetical protein
MQLFGSSSPQEKTAGNSGGFLKNGAGEETRTLDVHLGKVVLYQLSYARFRKCRKITA